MRVSPQASSRGTVTFSEEQREDREKILGHLLPIYSNNHHRLLRTATRHPAMRTFRVSYGLSETGFPTSELSPGSA